MNYKGLKTRGWMANLQKKEKSNGLVGAKNKVQGRPSGDRGAQPEEKRENE